MPVAVLQPEAQDRLPPLLRKNGHIFMIDFSFQPEMTLLRSISMRSVVQIFPLALF